MKAFYLFVFSVFLGLSLPSLAKNAAVVKKLRGKAQVTYDGATKALKDKEWVKNGAVVKTNKGSFVQLSFIDKSTMNIGPNSEMKIEKFEGNDAGVIDLVKGKIRSKVTKDYLKMKDKNRSKLFVKTQSAVMGVRGTDFMISASQGSRGRPGATSVVLFEGSVVFNKIDNPREVNTNNLEAVVNRGVSIKPGEFSVVAANASAPTIPAVMNVQQVEALEKNSTFNSSERKPASKDGQKKSVIPAGLTGEAVSNAPEVLKEEMANQSPKGSINSTPVSDGSSGSVNGKSDARGFVAADGKVKPANGSFVDINSGVVIPPDPKAVFDPTTNSFVGGGENGSVGSDGSFVPPDNVKITADGKVQVTVDAGNGKTKVLEVPPPSPVVEVTTSVDTAPSGTANGGPAGATLGGAFGAAVGDAIANGTAVGTDGAPTGPIGPAPAGTPENDVYNPDFNPGGLADFSNNQQNQDGGGVTDINTGAAQNNGNGRFNVDITVNKN